MTVVLIGQLRPGNKAGRNQRNLCRMIEQPAVLLSACARGVHKPNNTTLFAVILFVILSEPSLIRQHLPECFALPVNFLLLLRFFLYSGKGFILIYSSGRRKLCQCQRPIPGAKTLLYVPSANDLTGPWGMMKPNGPCTQVLQQLLGRIIFVLQLKVLLLLR